MSVKEQLIRILEAAYAETDSVEGFLEMISEQGVEPYYRGGRLAGVWYGRVRRRKYRLERLGLTQSRLKGLDRDRGINI